MQRPGLHRLAPLFACLALACGHGLGTGPVPSATDPTFGDDNPTGQPDLVGAKIADGRLMQGVAIPGTNAIVALMDSANGLCVLERVDLDTHASARLGGDASCDASRQDVVISPDGGTLYYLAALDPADALFGPMAVRRLALATGETSDVASVAQAAGGLALSPDGRSLVYSFEDWAGDGALEIHLLELATGSDVVVARANSNGEAAIAFSPDGAQLAFFDEGQQGTMVRRLTIATGASELLSDPVASLSKLNWTARGLQYVVPTTCSLACEALTNVTTGDRLGMYVDESLLAWSADGSHVAGATAWCEVNLSCPKRRIEIAAGDWDTHQTTVIARQDDCDLQGPYGMVVTPDGNRVVYGLCAGTYLWTRS